MEALVIIGALFAIVVGILWVCLPFAVFGIKKRLDEMISLQRQAINR
ncbi:hypothetical protein [Allopusillimonas ginsengisoli]|nr:hypothetical protein [Allopusillimonas ginsengisoli]